MEKHFKTVLRIPRVWKTLLEVGSFDDLTGFLEPAPPAQALERGGSTRADWPRPLRHDHRRVSFQEDGYTVSQELKSGDDHYYTVASVVLPNGERYAHTDANFEIHRRERLEVRDLGHFSWVQRLG
ncbi:MAG: hypothetical protein ABIZ04_01560 [Opitutus sp.]